MTTEEQVFDHDRWWETDPFLEGYGVGLVLHQVMRADQSTWIVARTLKGSPAAECGIQVGDRIEAVSTLSSTEYDLEELILFLRRPEKAPWVLHVINPVGARSEHSVVAQPLRRMVTNDHIAGGLNGGIAGGCVSCRKCLPSFFGYASCDPTPPHICQDRCSIA